MAKDVAKEPLRAWIVVFAGAACNLCLGILYAWSVWKKALVNKPKADLGEVMTGINAGWPYLTDSQGTFAYVVCGLFFAFFMIPGGRIQDKYGPKVGATMGGLFLAAGCIVAGLMKSYLGLMIGFGVLGGIGMGIGYAAPTPAALKWFGPHRRGLIAGIVVAGYGAAAIYIAPVGQYLIDHYGITTSFVGLGIGFAIVVVICGQMLSIPGPDYVPPGPRVAASKAGPVAPSKPAAPPVDWVPPEMMAKWQYYALVFMFIGSAQSGLLVIANAAPILSKTAGKVQFFAQNAWIIAAFGGFINAFGRVGTGVYSDKIGRRNAYLINGLVSAICLVSSPYIMRMESIPLLFLATGIAYWQYGGGLALMPAFTADFFGAKNLGANYGFVFIGWGLGFLMPLVAGYIKDYTGSYDLSFYISAGILLVAVAFCKFISKPVKGAPGLAA
jgi:MFS transporter, OFA family, oxalate/formate antiporter